ncbi:MAG: hypothetical protein KTV77_04680 [Wolbachia endosymbiont of Fragariocoptes setiger]|nr:hypothetical protein [Wolbachia endosymbiont of Fragariocoptes setiger]
MFSSIKDGNFMAFYSEINRNINFSISNENGQTPLIFAIKCCKDSESDLMKRERSKIVKTLLYNTYVKT